MNGVEIYVRKGGSTFTLHRTGSYIPKGNKEISRVVSEGYAATNDNHDNGPYRWFLVPESTLNGFEHCGAGSTKEIAFADCLEGPIYPEWYPGWWEYCKH